MNFPERSSNIGQVINSYLTNSKDLSDEVIHLMFSANRWEHMNQMKQKLLEGNTLIVDRYSYSGVAYSAAKGLGFDWCYAPERGLLKPDAVFYLRAPASDLASRGQYGEERSVVAIYVYLHVESQQDKSSTYLIPLQLRKGGVPGASGQGIRSHLLQGSQLLAPVRC